MNRVFWPRDLLPRVFPNSRIMTWGYDVTINHLISSSSKSSIYHHSETLLGDLAAKWIEESEKETPIIFIAHSLGGIVVKDALQLSAKESSYLKEIAAATIGVMFLGTPHHGSKTASLGKLAFRIVQAFLQDPNTKILQGLEVNSEILERISRGFGQLLAADRIRVHSFREELNTHGMMIVDSFSSTIGYFNETRGSLHANHRDMAKFTSSDDVKFQRVAAVLKIWISVSTQDQAIFRPEPLPAQDLETLPDGLIFDDQYRTCLLSLSSTDARRRLMEVDRAYEKTFLWLFEPNLGFRDWLRGVITDPLYWIQGKPGSGKSTAMKFAMRHPRTHILLKTYDSKPWIVAGYFFHDRGTAIQKSVRGFLGELLYQILDQRKDLFYIVLPIFSQLLDLQPSKLVQSDIWDHEKLEDALVLFGTTAKTDINLCVFVDALDEHDGDHKSLFSTLSKLRNLTLSKYIRLRLCVAGRPENLFKTAFQLYPGLAIQDYTTYDIRRYAQGRLRAELRSGVSYKGEAELNGLITDVIMRAQGVFLWVRLVIDEMIEGLCEGDTIHELSSLLSTIPSELEELYARALRRARRASRRTLTNHRYEAYVMFQVASHATAPFSLYVFLAASFFLTTGRAQSSDLERLSTDQMVRRLNSRSFGLLEAARVTKGAKKEHVIIAESGFQEGAGRTENASSNFPDDDEDSTEDAGSDEEDSVIVIDHENIASSNEAGGLDERSPVQFIHQTVKEFMQTGKGYAVIREGVAEDLQESGTVLMFRYILGLISNFISENADFDASCFVVGNFVRYAQCYEQGEHQRASDRFEPALSQLCEQQRHKLLTQIIDYSWAAEWANWVSSLRDRPAIQLLHFYVLCGLPDSFHHQASSITSELTEEESCRLLSCATLLDAGRRDRVNASPMKEALLRSSIGEMLLRLENTVGKIL